LERLNVMAAEKMSNKGKETDGTGQASLLPLTDIELRFLGRRDSSLHVAALRLIV
jgi:hypothetical protein